MTKSAISASDAQCLLRKVADQILHSTSMLCCFSIVFKTKSKLSYRGMEHEAHRWTSLWKSGGGLLHWFHHYLLCS